MPMRRFWLLSFAFTSIAGAQQLAVPGWSDPRTAWQRSSNPISGGVAFESGRPLTGHLLTATQAAGTDLIVRSVFRYRDAAGNAHGRSWQSAAAGFALSAIALEVGKSMAPDMVRQANARRLDEARRRAEALRLRGATVLPGLDFGDTIRLIPASTPPRTIPSEIRIVAASDVKFSGDGDSRILTAGDGAATPYRITSVLLHDDDAPRHAKGLSIGMAVGMVGGIAACVARFEYCYPYTTMWGAATAGYYIPAGTGPRLWRSISVREVP
jgi:hypothetical protein